MIGSVDVSRISDHLTSLEGVREKVEGSRATWRVQGRLVARLEDDETLLVHLPLADPDDVRPVLTAAWEMQRHA